MFRIKLDIGELQFFAHLSASPDWRNLAHILRKELAAHDTQLRVLPPTEVARTQGVADWIDKFLDKVEGAREQLAKLEQVRVSRAPAGSGIRRAQGMSPLTQSRNPLT